MGDFNKFQNSFLYYSFYALLICIIASEVFIFLFTYQKGKAKKHYYDKGTMNRPPEVRPKNLTIGGRFSYGKI